MKTQLSLTYPAPLSAVQAMLSDRTYLLSRLPSQAQDQAQVIVERSERGWTSTMTIDAPTDMIPAAVSRFLHGTVHATIVEQWTVNDESHASGNITVTVHGAPVKGSAQAHLHGDAQSTHAVVDVDFSVTVPLVGKKVEQAAVAKIDQAVAYEERLANAYLH